MKEIRKNSKLERDIMDQFSREEILFGKEKVNKLKNSKVLVFGLGGVGS